VNERRDKVISGRVLDADSKEGLSLSKIELYIDEGLIYDSTSADKNGYFSFSVESQINYLIIVRHPDYHNIDGLITIWGILPGKWESGLELIKEEAPGKIEINCYLQKIHPDNVYKAKSGPVIKSKSAHLIKTNTASPVRSIGRNGLSSPVKSKGNYITMPVYFATDRNYEKDNKLNDQFGIKRDKLRYGISMVSVPHVHKLGEIERPRWWRMELQENPEKHIVLSKNLILNNEDFFKNLSSSIRLSSKRSTFLFIHGYNVTFAEAARRTAQISYDLSFEGAAVFYSWPSQGRIRDYIADEGNIAWSTENIRLFLNDFLEKSDCDEIYIVAHSMGNRGLTKALNALTAEKPKLIEKIKEIILAAPDIDADVFKRDIAPKMVSTGKPITMYVSSKDRALALSAGIHKNKRIGDSKDGVIFINGIEMIDASEMETDFFGHSYYGQHHILSDIYDIIIKSKRAIYRPILKSIELPPGIYWKAVY